MAKRTKKMKSQCACGARSSTRCTCGEVYTKKDMDGGRCLSCGTMICAEKPKKKVQLQEENEEEKYPFGEPMNCGNCGKENPMNFDALHNAWICPDCDFAHYKHNVGKPSMEQKVRPAECIEPDGRKEFAAEFPEPSTCSRCGSDEPLYIAMASVNDMTQLVWICDACGYAHIPPRKKAWRITPEQEAQLKHLTEDMANLIENESHLDEARNLAEKVIKETLLQFRADLFEPA
jgi:hypothetical protein